MDPNVALKTLRESLKKVHELLDEEMDVNEHLDTLETLANSAEALDMWMSKGGFAPEGWPQRTHCAGCGGKL